MRNRLMVLTAAALMVAAVAMATGANVSPVVADEVVVGGACGPIGIGWTCSCTSTVVPNVACIVPGGGGEGNLVVTTCRLCPPPCTSFPCLPRPCILRTSYSCG